MPAPEPAETEHADLTDAEFAPPSPASPSSTPCGGLAGRHRTADEAERGRRGHH
jgi:hypothetical protein